MQPKISIVLPIHQMQGGAEFLWKSINMLTLQTFKDYELIITQEGKMAENTNAGISRARGELIKILYLDDILSNPNSLQEIVDNFTPETNWLITGCDTNPNPRWTDDLIKGNNKLGGPSCLTFRNNGKIFFDQRMSWLLDCDLYMELYNRYGQPKILPGIHVNIGIGDHQMTNILTDEEKLQEHYLIEQKHARSER